MTLRRTPQDFQVEERLDPEVLGTLAYRWSEATPFEVFRVSKTSLSTPDAVAGLCRALRVHPGVASYAGLKDKHAVTAQYISVRAADEQAARSHPEEHDGAGWRARRVGWAAAELKARAIVANDFALVVRDLDAQAIAAMDAAAAALRDERPGAPAGGLLIANYFGDQRFGSARHGQGFAGLSIVAGDFTQAIRLLVGTPSRKDFGRTREFTRICADHWGDWPFLAAGLPRCPERAPFERLAAGRPPADAFAAVPRFLQTMAIEALQSLLWNDTLRRMIVAADTPCATAPDAFGPLVFPHAAAAPDAWRALEIPMPSPETPAVAGAQGAPAWWPHACAALAAHGLTFDALRAPGMERPFFGHAMRHACVHASDFAMGAPQQDDLGAPGVFRRTVRFSLPRGAYATVLMRALGQ